MGKLSDASQRWWGFGGATCAAIVGVVSAVPSVSAGLCAEWQPGAGVPGVYGAVNAATRWDPDGPGGQPEVLVVAGQFKMAGDNLVNNIAVWNGGSWSTLGDGLGVGGQLDNNVKTLAIRNGELIAGGSFTASGATPLGHIARWNGSAWVRLNTGAAIDLDNTVNALAIMPNGDLMAGGSFINAGTTTVNRLARWDGATWSPINPAGEVKGVSHAVNALLVSGSDLYVGGVFSTVGNTTTGSTTVNRIARWTGSIWVTMGPVGSVGADGDVLSLASAPNGDILVGGSFSAAGGTGAGGIARWNGTSWSGMGTLGPLGPVVNAIAVTTGGDIVAGGYNFSGPSGDPTTANSLARWNGSSWQFIWTALDFGSVSSLTAEPGNTVLVGGAFKTASPAPANGVVRWNATTSAWSALSEGGETSGPVASMLPLPNGDVLVAGDFRMIDGVVAHRVAMLSGDTFSSMGTGLFDATGLHLSFSGIGIHAAFRQSNGNLLVGGSPFAVTEGGPAIVLAEWNGSSWSAYPSSAPLKPGSIIPFYPPMGSVHSIVMYNDQLIIGGVFFFDGNPLPCLVARWNSENEQWESLMDGTFFATVLDLMVMPDGSLVAAGGFTASEDDTNNIAIWDGEDTYVDGTAVWQPMGKGASGPVTSLALRSGKLIAGGKFTSVENTSGSVAANHIAEWNPATSTWSALGSGTPEEVNALLVLANNDLIAGGSPTYPNPVSSNNYIARWNGTTWSAIGTGVQANGDDFLGNTIATYPEGVYSLAETADADLLVGGNFATAGGTPSAYFARFGCETVVCAADFNGVNGVTVQDIFDFLTAWLAGSPTANFNGVNGVTVQDIFDFLTAWLAGC